MADLTPAELDRCERLLTDPAVDEQLLPAFRALRAQVERLLHVITVRNSELNTAESDIEAVEAECERLRAQSTPVTPELRAAAERLLNPITDWTSSQFDRVAVAAQRAIDVVAVANHILAHPVSDGAEEELADIDWLNKLRRVGGDMSWLKVRIAEDHTLRLMSPCQLPREGIDGLRDLYAPKPLTKNDVRSLAKMLGLTLIEGA